MMYTQTSGIEVIIYKTIDLKINSKIIPAIFSAPQNSRHDKLLILLHGYASNKESNINEIKQLAEAGYDVLAIDAPHHGNRNTNRLHEVENGTGGSFISFMLDVVVEQAEDITDIINYYSANGYKKFAVCGVSMGGISTFYLPTVETRVKHIIPIIGSPDWGMFGKDLTEEYALLNPADMPAKFKDVNVLAINAGKDVNVPPTYSEVFINKLQNDFGGEYFKYLVYPESEHFMRDNDWKDLWQQVIDWLNRNF